MPGGPVQERFDEYLAPAILASAMATKRTSTSDYYVRFPPETFARAKAAADVAGKTLRDFIVEATEVYVSMNYGGTDPSLALRAARSSYSNTVASFLAPENAVGPTNYNEAINLLAGTPADEKEGDSE